MSGRGGRLQAQVEGERRRENERPGRRNERDDEGRDRGVEVGDDLACLLMQRPALEGSLVFEDRSLGGDGLFCQENSA